jgi:uncharacterized protein
MKIDLRSLKDEVNYLELEESPSPAGGLKLEAEGVEFSCPVKLNLRLLKSGKNYIGKGEIETEICLECSRCLRKFTQNLKSEIRFLIQEEKDQLILEAEDRENQILPGSIFGLDDLVRESLILSLPFKPLCTENCKGLCPVCGADLNLSTCECKKDLIDPRWDKLKELKLGEKKKEKSKK